MMDCSPAAQPQIIIRAYGHKNGFPCIHTFKLGINADEAHHLSNPFDRDRLEFPAPLKGLIGEINSLSHIHKGGIFLIESYGDKNRQTVPQNGFYVQGVRREGEDMANHFRACAQEVWGFFNFAMTLQNTHSQDYRTRIDAMLRCDDRVVRLDENHLVFADTLRMNEDGRLMRVLPDRPAGTLSVVTHQHLAA